MCSRRKMRLKKWTENFWRNFWMKMSLWQSTFVSLHLTAIYCNQYLQLSTLQNPYKNQDNAVKITFSQTKTTVLNATRQLKAWRRSTTKRTRWTSPWSRWTTRGTPRSTGSTRCRRSSTSDANSRAFTETTSSTKTPFWNGWLPTGSQILPPCMESSCKIPVNPQFARFTARICWKMCGIS